MIPFEKLNIQTLDKDPRLIASARDSWDKREIAGVLCMMPNTHRMCFVVDNWPILIDEGLYEEALLDAYMGTRTNFADWSLDLLRFLFSRADASVLRSKGDPIPNQETFILYRGVSGIGRKRRVNALSWTDDPHTAAWFARRFSFPDPAVFTVTVPNSSILAHIEERNESEYLVRLPLPGKPKRLKEFPEPRPRNHQGGPHVSTS